MTDTDLNLALLDAADEGTLVIKHPVTGVPTTWVWTFYGPAHARTTELADRIARSSLHKLAERREAQINGRNFKEADETPQQLREENVANIIARTKSFTPVNLGEGPVAFSAEVAARLLLDRRKGWLLGQVMNFLKDEANFIQPSATS